MRSAVVLLRKAYKRKIFTDRDSYNYPSSVVRCQLGFGVGALFFVFRLCVTQDHPKNKQAKTASSTNNGLGTTDKPETSGCLTPYETEW